MPEHISLLHYLLYRLEFLRTDSPIKHSLGFHRHLGYKDYEPVFMAFVLMLVIVYLTTEVRGVSRLLADTTHTICEGELLQVGSAGQVDLTEQRYFEIIEKKTAVLYAMACRVGAKLSKGTKKQVEALERFGLCLGTAFQIADDALDLVGDEQKVGKSLGTDLKNGKTATTTSSSRTGSATRYCSIFATKLRCVSMTPLGSPVVPDL